MAKIFYNCDPDKNVTCKKGECFRTGGLCSKTSKIEYTSNPDIVTLVFDVDKEDAALLMQGDNND